MSDQKQLESVVMGLLFFMELKRNGVSWLLKYPYSIALLPEEKRAFLMFWLNDYYAVRFELKEDSTGKVRVGLPKRPHPGGDNYDQPITYKKYSEIETKLGMYGSFSYPNSFWSAHYRPLCEEVYGYFASNKEIGHYIT